MKYVDIDGRVSQNIGVVIDLADFNWVHQNVITVINWYSIL